MLRAMTENTKRDWSSYNKSLVARGSLTFWIDEDGFDHWHADDRENPFGRPRKYSDTAILTILTLRLVYKLPLRAAQGFMESIATLLGIELDIPDYSNLSRRQKTLAVSLPKRVSKEGIVLALDSTGLKVFGEGEWKVRQHGYSKRRVWRKLHLGVDTHTGQIEAAVFSESGCHDADAAKDLIDQVDNTIEQLVADGAYDRSTVYDALGNEVPTAIPPRKDARTNSEKHEKHDARRESAVQAVRQIGRAKWKNATGYHMRSISETAMYRYKQLIGDRLRSRRFDNQATEAFLGCRILNLMPG